MVYIHLPRFDSATYPEVGTYADLPNAADSSGAIYVVQSTTGVWPFRKSAGFYYSNGTAWSYLGDFSPSYIADLYESNADVNRFTDYYKDRVDNAASGEVLVLVDCSSGAAVGDLVIPSGTTDNAVDVLTTNSYAGLAFGMIHDKPTSTTANIQIYGSYAGATGLTRGAPVFVDVDGTPTTTRPTTGDLQVIGTALSSTRFFLDFAKTKVTLS